MGRTRSRPRWWCRLGGAVSTNASAAACSFRVRSLNSISTPSSNDPSLPRSGWSGAGRSARRHWLWTASRGRRRTRSLRTTRASAAVLGGRRHRADHPRRRPRGGVAIVARPWKKFATNHRVAAPPARPRPRWDPSPPPARGTAPGAVRVSGQADISQQDSRHIRGAERYANQRRDVGRTGGAAAQLVFRGVEKRESLSVGRQHRDGALQTDLRLESQPPRSGFRPASGRWHGRDLRPTSWWPARGR